MTSLHSAPRATFTRFEDSTQEEWVEIIRQLPLTQAMAGQNVIEQLRLLEREYTEEFCAKYDQTAFDPGYVSAPLAHYEPLIRQYLVPKEVADTCNAFT